MLNGPLVTGKAIDKEEKASGWVVSHCFQKRDGSRLRKPKKQKLGQQANTVH